MLVGPPCLNLTTPPPFLFLPPTSCKRLWIRVGGGSLLRSTRQGTALIWNTKGPLRTSGYVHFLFPWIKNIIKRTIYSLPLPKFYLISFVYVWTILYVCLTSVWNSKRWNKNKKALQRGLKKKHSMSVEFWSHHLSCLFFRVASYWK